MSISSSLKNLDEGTLNNIAGFICGDENNDGSKKGPVYRSSYYLTKFFKNAGLPQCVHDGSSRQKWVLECLNKCNEKQVESVILRLASPKEYGGKKEVVRDAVSQLNEILLFEELRITFNSGVTPIIKEAKVDIFIDKESITPNLKPKDKNNLIEIVCECLSSESANHLHRICENYGLDIGTIEEAFKSKRNYVYSRVTHLESKELWSLTKSLQGKYSQTTLDELINAIEDNDPLKIEASFDNQRNTILNELSKAEFTIWVAVAWFTNKEFADELWRKKKEGLNIQIIVIDDDINNKTWLTGEHFTTYKIPPTEKFNNRMHHKFCVIDLKTVIHGSYNWTIMAEYNNETIEVIKNRSEAETYAKEFIRLKSDFIKNITST